MSVNRLVSSFRRYPQVFLNVKRNVRYYSNQTKDDLATDTDTPVKFSTSDAAGWKASLSRQGLNKPDESPWFESWLVLGSVASILIYFCILREENDIDEKLALTLYDRIDGLEKLQLEASLEYYLEHNKDTTAIRRRLQELEQEAKMKAEKRARALIE